MNNEPSTVWMRRCWKILAGLLLLRLVLMAVVPVFELSEARYAAISANMARTGDFVVPRFTYEGRYQSFDGKPPLVFQAGGLFCKALGTESPYALQFAVRIFPLLSSVLLLVILFHSVKRTSGAPDSAERSERAWLAVVICATCTAFYAAAGISMTDMTLTCCVAGALLLYEVYLCSARMCTMALIAALLGAGMIVKGPVALVLFGLPVLADAIVNRHWKRLFNWKWLLVAPIFLAVAVPWFVLIEQRNPGAVWYFFYNENFMRFISHDYGDKYGAGREAFRGVSILWALVATLPWALVPIVEKVRKLKNKIPLSTSTSSLLSSLSTFDVLAIFAIVGFWCLTSRVLLYYLFPMIPLFAAALAKTDDRARLKRLVPWGAGISALVLSVGLLGGVCFVPKMQGPKLPENYGFDGYAHEFYHGTNPRCLTERGVSCDDWVRDRWLRTPEAKRWLETPEGKRWMALPGMQQWMKEWGYAK